MIAVKLLVHLAETLALVAFHPKCLDDANA